ncbi:MAG: DNA primase [Verrucomicrobia bacterium]|nr:MAG: DNA primase [Verrucomicrobiota bacterium]
MPSIKAESIRNLKDRVSIVDVVSPIVTLKRAGAQFKGLSPFNSEKTPSFFVSPDKGLFKCYSSGKAGDVISFVMETERLNFVEAVESLAGRFNVPLEYDAGYKPEERSLRQELFDLHDYATDYYHQRLQAEDPLGSFARDYWINDRGFPIELAAEFKIGIAPPTGIALAKAMADRFSGNAMRESGLFYGRSDGRYYDRFRGRLMIPIRDHQSRVIAFTARQLELTPAEDPSRDAKYINSPETKIFVKGSILFNLDRARLEVNDDTPFLMVEGQLDALRCWQVGLKASVAPQGTGVTETQLSLLRRYQPHVDCLLDGDEAGQRAALRLLPIALRVGLEVRLLILQPGDDPDTLLLKHGPSAVEELRRNAVDAIAFACHCILPEPETASPLDKSRASRELFELITNSSSDVAKSAYLEQAAVHLSINPQALESDYATFARIGQMSNARKSGAGTRTKPQSIFAGRFPSAEEDLIQLILHYPEYGPSLTRTLHHEWIDTKRMPGRLLDRFMAEIEHDNWPGLKGIDSLLETQDEKVYIASLIFERLEPDSPDEFANEGIKRILTRFCQAKINEIELEIARKQETFDDEVIVLFRKKKELLHLKSNPPKLKVLP